ncbi:hypothetical protein PPYR_10278 [Photinus pyralis]|uniref:Uncharacterized protein n=3 Tax=Photinus pyralis TaxID=7054 RepID=A0A5N4AFW5_PHOPY|nr:hypothetical protein PPYR_10278 [Photinus pyralis]
MSVFKNFEILPKFRVTFKDMIKGFVSQLNSKSAPTLYYSSISPPALSALMVAKTLNVEVNLKNVNMLTKDYLTQDLLEVNPQHTIPTLVDGGFSIWDSHAIAGYLVGQYGQDDRLYPKDSKRRAQVDQKLHFDTEHLFPCVHETVFPLLFRGKSDISKFTRKKVERTYLTLEEFLKRSDWLAGNNVTIADLCCCSSISVLDYLIPVREAKPRLFNYIQRCSALPHYQDVIQKGVDQLGNKIQESLISTYIKHYTLSRNNDH